MIKALLYAVMIVYIAGALLYFAGNKTGKTSVQKAALLLSILGCLLNGVILVLRWILSGRAPLSSGGEFMLCFSFLTVLMYLIYELKSKDNKAGGVVILIGALLVISVVALMAEQLYTVRPLTPALKSSLLSVHVLTATVSYSAFALAAGLATRNIMKKDYTRYTGSIYRIVAGGFAMLSLSIVLGAIWAEQAWGSYWSWDPKETWALVTWIIYALYLHLHKRRSWAGKKANIIVLAGFILVLFTFFGVNYIIPGLHSYA